jgi:hypothetical protein
MTFRERIRKVDCDPTRGSEGFSKFASPAEGKKRMAARINTNKFTISPVPPKDYQLFFHIIL